MINALIRWSILNRALVLLGASVLLVGGIYAVRVTPVDAIPDLSDVQVIIKTRYPGQAPQVVQDQVTYPLTTAMLAVPKAATVRGYSFFGDSYVYVIFEDGTDLYWARSRVLEYLNQVVGKLPASARPQLGPDATGVGWVYQYALVDRSGHHNLADLRTLQDWFLKFELQALPGVAEIATVGGMVKQYQVEVDPNRLRAYDLPLSRVIEAIRRANRETGASVIEMAEAEYMVRTSGYLQSAADIREVPLGLTELGTPISVGDVGEVREGPQMRRGVADLDGEGEVVGGIVVMRFGENARRTIAAVKARLEALRSGLPEGVEIVEVYDRSALIDRAVSNLYGKLAEEFLAVVLVCAAFLLHLRSSLVVILSLPLAVLAAFLVMRWQGLNANIMSLGGIAIAIGAMVDGAIVMIENLHKHLENAKDEGEDHWEVVLRSCREVGAPIFFSLFIITLSFLPVFALQAQEGRLFSPLAFTKTYAMAAAAVLAITLVPVLLGYLVRGRIRPEQQNPLNRALIGMFQPFLRFLLDRPWSALGCALVLTVVGLLPLTWLGSEFMPPLDEGDLLYMPTTFEGVSIGKARELLQQTDRLIRTVPEVETVFGKAGRADTATDPAPMMMFETTIRLKPREHWREGMTMEKLRDELNALVRIPGLANSWVMPIKARIDMLATGIRTPVGVKVAGPDLAEIERIGKRIESVLAGVSGTASVYSERVAGGRYIQVQIDRTQAARYRLNIADLQQIIATAIGGVDVTETVEGLERFPVNLRYPQHHRDSVEQLAELPIVTPTGERIALADVARVFVETGPSAIKSENARLNGWIYVDIAGRDLGSYVMDAQRAVAEGVELPPGYSLNWSGQYEYLERATERLQLLVPVTLIIIVVLLFLNFRRGAEVALILCCLPLALTGGIWYMYLADFRLSVAAVVGFIALGGVAVEICVLKLTYIEQAWQRRIVRAADRAPRIEDLREAVIEGSVKRVRPIMMTVGTVMIGLVPVMLDDSTGSDVMQRIAAPMVGGMATTLLLTLMVIPTTYYLWQRRRLARGIVD
jgi:Cu(I)/Ag(I) efflux system membrane protein CusA/SilA